MRAYLERETLRLHTPGHKGKLNALDITELSDGSFPDHEIADAEKKIARIYGAKHAHLLCGGSSQGVKASIYFVGGDGIVDVNSHRSVFDGFKLSGKNAVGVGIRGMRPITAADIKAAIADNIKTAVVTSPTYYGFCADLDGIRALCKEYGLTLIVDGAHGAHFGFSDKLPEHFAHIPDICNVSSHKTLCALTQTAIAFDNLSDEDSLKYKETLALFGTTSPSYPLLSSIEDGVDKAADRCTSTRYTRLYNAITDLKSRYPFVANDDFTRLVLDCGAFGGGEKFNTELSSRGVMSEMFDERYVVFIVTAEDSEQDIARLDKVLFETVKVIKD